MQLIDGKATAAAIKQEIKAEVEQIVAAGGKRPHLAAVLVGHDGGSETYVRNKVKACEECGFESSLIRYEDDVTEAQLLAEIDRLTTVLMALSFSCLCPNIYPSRKSLKPLTTVRMLTVSILSM